MKIKDYMKIADQSKFNELLRLQKPFKWYTQKVLFQTHLFGKDYFWMEDVDGQTYLLKEKDGLPSFL